MSEHQKTLHALLTPSRMDQLRMRCGLRGEDATDADYLTPDPERLTCPGCKAAVAADGGRPMTSPRCDKAHHGDAAPVADVVLRCQGCGRVYARCADCERYRPGSAEASMRAHLRSSHCLSRAARLSDRLDEEGAK